MKKLTKRMENWNKLVQRIVNPPKRYKHQKLSYGKYESVIKPLRGK